MGGHPKIGIPKLNWSDVIRKGKKDKGVQRDEAHYRTTWWMETRSVDPKEGNAEQEVCVQERLANLDAVRLGGTIFR